MRAYISVMRAYISVMRAYISVMRAYISIFWYSLMRAYISVFWSLHLGAYISIFWYSVMRAYISIFWYCILLVPYESLYLCYESLYLCYESLYLYILVLYSSRSLLRAVPIRIPNRNRDRFGTGWRRLIASPKLQIVFHERATKCRSLLRKMTYKDKGSYESSPPCTTVTKWHNSEFVTSVTYYVFLFFSENTFGHKCHKSSQMQKSQMVTNSHVIGTNLFLFLFRLKWFGMNETRQNIPESELCFLSGTRIGTALIL